MQTYTRVVCAVAIALSAAPIAATAADIPPCELFSEKEITSALGVTLGARVPSGELLDWPGRTEWGCVRFPETGGHVFVTVFRYRSAADAKHFLKVQVDLHSLGQEEGPPVSEVPGPGEQNWWWSNFAVDGSGGTWLARRGLTGLEVTANLHALHAKRPESLRERIRDLVAVGLKRLQ